MEKNDADKVDDEMLPGFRFHPTDEELVGFYLIRKIQQRPLPIELIKQVDIYKYDPWDLPKLASTGEKEWYFYCPRDRKYRNSSRPNRVTAAGFWKATGTDRPIYSDGKCIGLKKSLVFYRGRAAKGIKTDWMMHEFRLPPLSDSSPSKKVLNNKSFAASDAWAICRIFKKTSSMAQRAFSHSWMSALPETTTISGDINPGTNKIGSPLPFCGTDIPPYKPSQFPSSNGDFSDSTSILFNPALMNLDESNQNLYGFSSDLQNDMNIEGDQNGSRSKISAQVGSRKNIGFPFSLSPDEGWKPQTWDSFTCPNEMSSEYSTSKCCN